MTLPERPGPTSPEADGNRPGVPGEGQTPQTALKEAAERRRQLMDISRDGIAVISQEHRVLEANRRFAEMLGYRPEEVLDLHTWDWEANFNEAEIRARFANLLHVDATFETRHRRKDGSVFDVEVSATGGVVDGAPVVITVSRDISARKDAARALAESEERYRILADYSPDWQYWVSPKGEYLYVSPGCEAICGRPPEAFQADPSLMCAIMHPDDRAVWQQHWQGVTQTPDLHPHENMELRIVTPQGQVRWIEHQCREVRDLDGRYRGRRGVNRDITARKAAQREVEAYRDHLEELVAQRTRELEEARQRAEDANRAKSTFLANMSHEIRTPMNAIIGLTHLARRSSSSPKQAEQFDKIAEAAQHLLNIINDILDLSKIEAGKLVLEHTDFRLQHLIDRTLDLIRDKTTARGITLTGQVSPELPAVLRGDVLRLSQVLLNFASNAAKFTEQGSIHISADPASARADDDRPRVRFQVRDTGIGIAPAVRDRLFGEFEQADNSTARNYGGTGLGLAICKRLVRLMGNEGGSEGGGGTLGVDSQPGQGSTFWFEIPLALGDPDKLPEAPAALGANPADLRGVRVLLAEDNKVNQEVALDLLADLGLVADVAADGAEAVRLAAARPYDLILMDMQMPVMDGLDATRAIRALPGRESVPILAMTANAFEEDRRHCLEAGMNDHLAKPVTPQTLFAALIQWLPRDKQPAEVPAPHPEAGQVPPAEPGHEALFAVPGLDPRIGLKTMNGKWPSYERLLRLFTDSHQSDITWLRQRHAAGEIEEARRIAHSLKGASGALGALSVRDRASALEAALRAGAPASDIVALAEQAQDALTHLVADLAQALDHPEHATGVPSAGFDAALARLERLLRTDDMGAADALRELLPALERRLPAETLARLTRQVQAYDFEAALAVLLETTAARPVRFGP